MDQNQLERMVFALYNESGDANTAILEGTFNSDGTYTVYISSVRPMTAGIMPKFLTSYVINDNGDYTNENTNEKGNLFKDVTEEEIANQRADVTQAVTPKLTQEQFVEAIKQTEIGKSFNGVVSGTRNHFPEEAGYVYATVQSPPNQVFRFNLETGEVEKASEQIAPSDEPVEWKYDFDGAMKAWEEAAK